MTGIELIAKERERQIKEEGWSQDHDSEHIRGELALAAACYAINSSGQIMHHQITRYWPWGSEWWKPKDRKKDLIRAGALIAAELDRLNALEGV